METPQWPVKTRELQTAVLDSTRWNGFRYRDGDIVVATWAKSGTTWMQQIVSQIILGGPEGLGAGDTSPWLDMRVRPLDDILAQLEAQEHRRCIKTHLPLDALVFSPKARYIYVARDARDVVWSAYNHHSGFTPEILARFNETPGRVGPPVALPDCDIREYYLRFLELDSPPGFPIPDFWGHVQGWWDAGTLSNVLLVHYNALKADLPGEMRRVAAFLDAPVDEALWPTLLEHCSFDYMRTTGAQDPGLGFAFKEGGKTFFHRGVNGRWREVLSAEEIQACDDVAARRLTPDCAHWLATGEMPEGANR